jgi:uncharacterized Tic20 family protein
MSDVIPPRVGSAESSVSHPNTETARDEYTPAALAHAGGLLWFVPSLSIYLRSRSEPSPLRREAKEALNWQITATIGYVVLSVVATLVGGILLLTPLSTAAGWVWLLPVALYAVNAALSIVAGLRVRAAGAYRYPVAIRLIK